MVTLSTEYMENNHAVEGGARRDQHLLARTEFPRNQGWAMQCLGPGHAKVEARGHSTVKRNEWGTEAGRGQKCRFLRDVSFVPEVCWLIG